MNETIEVIKRRRSIRKFKPKRIPGRVSSRDFGVRYTCAECAEPTEVAFHSNPKQGNAG